MDFKSMLADDFKYIRCIEREQYRAEYRTLGNTERGFGSCRTSTVVFYNLLPMK